MNPTSLLFYLSTKDAYRPTIISENEIFCSPEETDTFEEGVPTRLKTPVGRFDAKEIFDKIPPEKRPELIVLKLDATMRCVPIGLGVIDCPKVFILGAPHQFSWPLTGLLRYLEEEKFDFIISDHDRHQLHYFKRAGFENTHWIPALNYNMRSRPIAKPIVDRAVFVGQTGQFHPYRRELFNALSSSGVPVDIGTAPGEKAADLYSQYAISLNGSLNGDLNLRVFEILGSGGFLLTDKLSYDSGLEMLFEADKEIALYSSIDELKEKIRYYLANPDEVMAMRKTANEKILAKHRPEQKRQQLMDIIYSGSVDPELALRDERFLSLSGLDRGQLYQDVAIYEYLQEAHIGAARLDVYCRDPEINPVLSFCWDLPRIALKSIDQGKIDDDETTELGLPVERYLAVELKNEDPSSLRNLLEAFVGDHVILLGDGAEAAKSVPLLADHGFQGVEGRVGVFQVQYGFARAQKLSEMGAGRAALRVLEKTPIENFILEELVEAAQFCAGLGRKDLCLRFLDACLELDRSLVDVYIAIGNVLDEDSPEELDRAFEMLSEGNRIRPLTGEAAARLESLGAKIDRSSEGVSRYLDRIGQAKRPTRMKRAARVIVYTNLFPPQELGGYGRKMWEFAHELWLRGHEIKVLSGDAPYLYKEPQGEEKVLEPFVERSLEMYGDWADGSANVTCDGTGVNRVITANREKAEEAIKTFAPDYCLMGNLDMIGHSAIEAFTQADIPVIQCMGNCVTGWMPDYVPDPKWFRSGPASDFLLGELRGNGFRIDHPVTFYPGARIDRFYRSVLPRYDVPRIAFAGLLLPYKGAHTLVEALTLLQQGGIDFVAEIAGDSTDRKYVDGLKNVIDAAGLNERVRFPGFLNRQELMELFCRSNILVFPSEFEEPFGISQVEGMASGMVTITTARGGSKEIIRDEIDGLWFEKGDAVDLAKKIASLVADPEKWKRLGSLGRDRSLEFAIPKTVDKIEDTFIEMKTL